MMRFGSCFAGIGGFDLGLERAGMKCAWQIENDPYCIKVLEKHWPKVKRYEDIRCVSQPEQVDLICGGFPCQDISNAGPKQGIRGSRSSLWNEMFRLVYLLRPTWAIVENVSALRHRGLTLVLQDLNQIGYCCEFHCIPAYAFGAPHKRDRIFVVAHSAERRCQSLFNGEPESTDVISLGTDVAHPIFKRLEGYTGNVEGDREWPKEGRPIGEEGLLPRGHTQGWWQTEPQLGRVANGIPRRVDRLRCLGNAVVPQIVEWLGLQIMEIEDACKKKTLCQGQKA